MIEVATSAGSWMSPGSIRGTKSDYVTGQWYHIAVSRVDSINIKWWVDGVLDATATIASGNISSTSNPRIGHWGGGWDIPIDGYVDEYRMQVGESPQLTSGDPLYISGGTGFTPPTSAYSASSVSATGSYESTAQTANASVTTMSGVVTYTNASGTATLNTDIVLELSADNGSKNPE